MTINIYNMENIVRSYEEQTVSALDLKSDEIIYHTAHNRQQIHDDSNNYVISAFAQNRYIDIIKGYEKSLPVASLNRNLLKCAIEIYTHEKVIRREHVTSDIFNLQTGILIVDSFEKIRGKQHDFFSDDRKVLFVRKEDKDFIYYPTSQIRNEGKTELIQIFKKRGNELNASRNWIFPIYGSSLSDYKKEDIITFFNIPQLCFIADDANNNPKLFYQRARTVFLVNHLH